MAFQNHPLRPDRYADIVLNAQLLARARMFGGGDEDDCKIYEHTLTDGPNAGMHVQVLDMLYNHRLVLAYPNEMHGYERGFCMPKNFDAVRSAQAWDGQGDPDMPWIKEIGTERIGPAHPRYDHQKDLYPHLDESALHLPPPRARASHADLQGERFAV